MFKWVFSAFCDANLDVNVNKLLHKNPPGDFSSPLAIHYVHQQKGSN